MGGEEEEGGGRRGGEERGGERRSGVGGVGSGVGVDVTNYPETSRASNTSIYCIFHFSATKTIVFLHTCSMNRV